MHEHVGAGRYAAPMGSLGQRPVVTILKFNFLIQFLIRFFDFFRPLKLRKNAILDEKYRKWDCWGILKIGFWPRINPPGEKTEKNDEKMRK